MQTKLVAIRLFILIIVTNVSADLNKILMLTHFPFNVRPERFANEYLKFAATPSEDANERIWAC